MLVFSKNSFGQEIATDGKNIYIVKNGGVYVPNYPKGTNGYRVSMNFVKDNAKKMPRASKRPIVKKCA